MKIFFSKKQYEALMKLAFLGDWFANAHRTGDLDEELREVGHYIHSFAGDFGLGNLVEKDETSGKVYPSREFEEALDHYIDEYNDENFWDELIHRLAERDLIEHYGDEAVSLMSFEERIEKETPFLEKYETEFCEKGLENLKLR